MPPTVIRRPLTITAWLVMSSACLILSPLLLAAAALAGGLLRRPEPMVVARMVIQYCSLELRVLLACGGLWVLSGCGARMRAPRFQHAHYRLLEWFVHGLSARARQLLDVDIDADRESTAARRMAVDRPLLLFSRHAGPGDSVLLLDLLMGRYHRRPSVVFKDALAIDPCIDLLGHRLPHAVLDRSDTEECEDRIAEVAADLGPRGVLVLFPEGGNFTPERRRRAIASLRRRGRRRQARAAEQMTHVLPPHPGGALAALRGNPDCDVVFAAHAGLGLAAFPAQLWRDAPFHRTLTTRMWLVPAAERPRDRDAQVQWLYRWWRRIDEWVAEQGEVAP